MTVDSQSGASVKKYEVERNKRVGVENFAKRVSAREDGFEDLRRDPWADYDALAREEPAMRDGDNLQFVIVGAGHNGIIFAAELIRAGFDPKRLVVVDESGGFGGAWYWNRYPGLTCDVESYCYLPLLEDTGNVPKHRYSRGEEIRNNAERIAAKFGIRGMFCTQLLGADWNEADAKWVLKFRRDLGPTHKDTSGEFTVRTQFFLPAFGSLSIPSVPKLPGLDQFRKTRTMFHTSRWNYSYTGGTQQNPELVNLKDKVIGIIGTGATAVQAVPELARWAKRVYVFQRTPSYVGPRTQVETTPELWAKVATGPGWQLERQKNLDGFLSDDPTLTEEDNLLKDGWSHSRGFAGVIGSPRARDVDFSFDKIPAHIQAMVERDLPFAEELRAHVAEVVKDPETAAKLTAWYPMWCKRPTFHQTYLQAFNQPNVTLVDTDGLGVQAYTSRGVIVGTGDSAKEYELDALVLATGFVQEEGRALGSAGAPIRGRGGNELKAHIMTGPGMFLGVATPGFPNMFFSSSAGGTASANTTTIFDINAETISKLLTKVLQPGHREESETGKIVVEADVAATKKHTDVCSEKQAWFAGFAVCPPTFITMYKDPKDSEPGRTGEAVWPYGPVEFRKHISEYVKGDFEGFNVTA